MSLPLAVRVRVILTSALMQTLHLQVRLTHLVLQARMLPHLLVMQKLVLLVLPPT